MYCKHCGEKLNDNQAACLKCGVAVGKGEQYCAHCGAAVCKDAAVCVKCGVAIKKDSKFKSFVRSRNDAVAYCWKWGAKRVILPMQFATTVG